MKLLESIGNTPLVDLERIWDPDQSGVRVRVKLEGANPGGSLKDRPACFMIQEAITSGAMSVARDLPRGSTVVAILPDRGDRYLSSQVFASKCAICPP
ncbi:pyridoxal-phosphate dependent enzyme [Desulfurivibrio alkaliphilus]|uniref:Pyridoxal-5'-phosphate-dependent protein beta subunit n=1 Tax=Desulfurivibrio alkaliphilus (strain DSM 19089 / UNIQEM U267 / AHT2) TaxID=589865 RepID=D6Z743_DESAT|nr:pyridoxal-phosphate dependent enzyme [Desulfurivibrio alkaliphilus]ADH87030.1 Pyridoxal-5'-phosphate-dependent protein beta subunit [Desulfurivibrio alkaliphilus AHT 2]